MSLKKEFLFVYTMSGCEGGFGVTEFSLDDISYKDLDMLRHPEDIDPRPRERVIKKFVDKYDSVSYKAFIGPYERFCKHILNTEDEWHILGLVMTLMESRTPMVGEAVMYET